MIDVNITIIIQMINFFIGFLLLKYLLFKPASRYLLLEEKKEEITLKEISTEENDIKNKIDQKSFAWAKCKEYFKKNCPKSITESPSSMLNSQYEKDPFAIEISDKEAEMLIKHAQKALLDRIDHVRD